MKAGENDLIFVIRSCGKALIYLNIYFFFAFDECSRQF